MNGTETIPIDLITEILSYLPAESIEKFRCVSKLWESTLAGSYFTELFLTRSSARPHLLFAIHRSVQSLTKYEWRFYSSPQPQCPDENTSHVYVDFCMSLDLGVHSMFEICAPVSGLIFCPRFQQSIVKLEPLICNTTTKQQYVSLPMLTQEYVNFKYFGYDPIDKQYKLLCISYDRGGKVDGFHLLTFGCQEELSWRSIECPTSHKPRSSGICFNGVLYYVAQREDASRRCGVVCFDVRSEKFKFLDEPDEAHSLWPKNRRKRPHCCLTSFKGKLVLIRWRAIDSGKAKLVLSLWVLEDCKKPEWSTKQDYGLSLPNYIDASGVGMFRIEAYVVGMIGTGEIVLTTSFVTSNVFYVFYFNPKRNTLKKVKIQGIQAYRGCKVKTFLNHVENVKNLRLLHRASLAPNQ